MYYVTGGAGFIGSNLVASLTEHGHEVVVCDRFGTDDKWRNLAHHEVADLIIPERSNQWLDEHRDEIDAVVHMGAVSATTETDVDFIVEQNVRLTLDLYHWCARNECRFIYASSAATYGDGSAGFRDDDTAEGLARLHPLNPYGWSKHVVDRRIHRLRTRPPLPPQCVGLKFFNVYGPNEYHKGSMRSVLARNWSEIAAGAPLRLFRSTAAGVPDGGQQRDFVYVRDCVDVLLWLLKTPHINGLFNIGCGTPRTWLDLGKAVFAAMGVPPRIEFIDMPASLASRYQNYTAAPLEKLREAGYRTAFTSLEDGILDYVTNYLSKADPYR